MRRPAVLSVALPTALPTALATALATVALALVPGAAQAQGAQDQGWWNALHRAGAPAPPTPPDVAADDLLLQGGDPARLLPAGAVDQTPAPSALAALRFQVLPGVDVGGLVLQLGAGAQAADVRAYPTASAWKAEQNGAIEAAPTPDYQRFSTGRLSADATTLTFPDLGRLVTEGGLLSVVLVPGPADRVVIHRPQPTALTVVQPASQPQPSATTAPPADLPPAGPVVLPPLPAVGLPPVQAAPSPVPAVVAPVAPQPVVAAAAAAPSAAATRLVADDGRTRLLVGLEALLVLAFFGLLGQGPLARLAALSGARDVVTEERGLGRFRAARTGPVPHL